MTVRLPKANANANTNNVSDNDNETSFRAASTTTTISPDPNSIETFYGLIESTSDAFRVFDLCRRGRLGRIRRRLHDKERRLIRSGSVFCFDEAESGIKRWTDGRLWSPSRILGNFLIYRELGRKMTHSGILQQPQPPSSSQTASLFQRKAKGRSSSSNAVKTPTGSSLDFLGDLAWLDQPLYQTTEIIGDMGQDSPSGIPPQRIFGYIKEDEILGDLADPTAESLRRLEASWRTLACASTTSSALKSNSPSLLYGETRGGGHQHHHHHNNASAYQLKPDGLIKKTISARVDGRLQHLVCYYNKVDFCEPNASSLQGLPQMLELRTWPVPIDLMLHQNFRKPPLADDPLLKSTTTNQSKSQAVERKRRHSAPSITSNTNATGLNLDVLNQVFGPNDPDIKECVEISLLGENDLPSNPSTFDEPSLENLLLSSNSSSMSALGYVPATELLASSSDILTERLEASPFSISADEGWPTVDHNDIESPMNLRCDVIMDQQDERGDGFAEAEETEIIGLMNHGDDLLANVTFMEDVPLG